MCPSPLPLLRHSQLTGQKLVSRSRDNNRFRPSWAQCSRSYSRSTTNGFNSHTVSYTSLFPTAQTLTISCTANDQLCRRSVALSSEPSTIPSQPIQSSSPTLDVQPSSTSAVQPSPASAIRPSPASTIQPSPTSTVRPSPASTVQPSPALTVRPSPTSAVQPSPNSAVRPSPASAVRPSPASTIQPSPTSTVQPSPASTVRPSPASTVRPSPASTVRPSPTSTVRPSPTSAVQPSPTSAVRPSPALAVRPSPTLALRLPSTPVFQSSQTPVTPTAVDQPSPAPVVEPPPAFVAQTLIPELDLLSAPGPTAVSTPVSPVTSVSTGGYPKFITPEVLAHLSGITNVEGWSDLVQIYLKFETASPSKSVSYPSTIFFGTSNYHTDDPSS
jgi:hypothetical protein